MEVVQQLRCVQEAYEHPSSADSSSSQLCSNLLSLAAHIWPTIVPDSLLVKLWMSVKDKTLQQVHLHSRKTSQYNFPLRSDNTNVDQLIQTINVFLSQCPDLPFDLFWEECACAFIQISTHEEIDVAMSNMYSARQLLQGLLHLIAINCACKSPFSNPKFEEASLARLCILVRLTLDQNGEDDELLTNMIFPKWNTYRSIRFSFQMILQLVQSEAVSKLDFTQAAWHLLKDLRLANEEEWIGCLAALLHQILRAYLEKGQIFLEQRTTKALLRLFSNQVFAQSFLNCITLNPDPHRSTASALSAAFQIFELVYVKHSATIIACCLAKAVDEQSDMVLLRLQCLNQLLKVCLMKARDQDEKVRLMALQFLRKFPVKTLAECLTAADWNAICKRGFSEEKKEIRGLVEALLLDYITTEFLAETPTARLRILDLLGEGEWAQQHSSFVFHNVEAIFEREVEYLECNFGLKDFDPHTSIDPSDLQPV